MWWASTMLQRSRFLGHKSRPRNDDTKKGEQDALPLLVRGLRLEGVFQREVHTARTVHEHAVGCLIEPGEDRALQALAAEGVVHLRVGDVLHLKPRLQRLAFANEEAFGNRRIEVGIDALAEVVAPDVAELAG